MEREDAGHALRGVYVLLVDDNSQHRNALREILRYCGAWVREAASTEEALAVLRETTPTALVVAVRPPGDAAWLLVRGVRAMPPEHGGKMPIVGVGPVGLAVQARAEGFDGYLSEPIEAWALCRAVGELTE
jgi:CheY-like chemotaxis protein